MVSNIISDYKHYVEIIIFSNFVSNNILTNKKIFAMKKVMIIAMLFAATMLCGNVANAQCNKKKECKKECVDKKDCKKDCKKSECKNKKADCKKAGKDCKKANNCQKKCAKK